MKFRTEHEKPRVCPNCGADAVVYRVVRGVGNNISGVVYRIYETYVVACSKHCSACWEMSVLTKEATIYFWNTKVANRGKDERKSGRLIKPCPKCGGTGKAHKIGNVCTVTCENCISYPMLPNITKETAIDLWNDDISLWWLSDEEIEKLPVHRYHPADAKMVLPKEHIGWNLCKLSRKAEKIWKHPM